MSDSIKDFKMYATGDEGQVTFPSAILENIYMDNEFNSFPTTKKEINTSTKVIKTLSVGCFELGEFISRSQKILKGLLPHSVSLNFLQSTQIHRIHVYKDRYVFYGTRKTTH